VEVCGELHAPATFTSGTSWIGSRNGAVGVMTRYGLDGPGIKSRGEARFSAPLQIGSGPPSFLCIGYRLLPGGKAAGARR
jgi:hypothetical protein